MPLSLRKFSRRCRIGETSLELLRLWQVLGALVFRPSLKETPQQKHDPMSAPKQRSTASAPRLDNYVLDELLDLLEDLRALPGPFELCQAFSKNDERFLHPFLSVFGGSKILGFWVAGFRLTFLSSSYPAGTLKQGLILQSPVYWRMIAMKHSNSSAKSVNLSKIKNVLPTSSNIKNISMQRMNSLNSRKAKISFETPHLYWLHRRPRTGPFGHICSSLIITSGTCEPWFFQADPSGLRWFGGLLLIPTHGKYKKFKKAGFQPCLQALKRRFQPEAVGCGWLETSPILFDSASLCSWAASRARSSWGHKGSTPAAAWKQLASYSCSSPSNRWCVIGKILVLHPHLILAWMDNPTCANESQYQAYGCTVQQKRNLETCRQ